MPLLLAAPVCQQLLAPIQIFSLGSSHPQAEALFGRTCFKETQAGIPGAQGSHSFKLSPWGWGEQALCPMWTYTLLPGATLAFLSHWVSQAGVIYQSPNSRCYL